VVSRTSTATPIPAPVIDANLKKLMRSLKPGRMRMRMLDTLPERLALASSSRRSPDCCRPSGLRGLVHLLP
jgi:hypothetical protein